jgi:ketosteroid isomerase-like protein
MKPHPIELLIHKAGQIMNQADFDALVDFYADDVILVVRPGMNAVGKAQIKKAFEAIAEHCFGRKGVSRDFGSRHS